MLHCGQLILRKIGALQRSPEPWLYLRGPLLREGRKGRGRGMKEKKGEGRGKEDMEGQMGE